MFKVVANWKMYLTIEESKLLAARLVKMWEKQECNNVELVICPSDLALSDVSAQVEGSPIKLGIQDLSLSPALGAFTGQTAPQQLKETLARHVILGHSERRKFYGVTDAMVEQQLHVALEHKLIPIVCVGETQAERDNKRTDQIITSQLHSIFEHTELPDYPFYIAYEPRWAIGTGIPVDPKEAERVHDLIRHTMIEFHKDANKLLHVLYGGSVDSSNILGFLDQPSVDGALIGGASSKLEKLREIVKVLQKNVC